MNSNKKKSNISIGAITLIASVTVSTGIIGLTSFHKTQAETTVKNTVAHGEPCEISSGQKGVKEDVIFNTPFAYSNDEINKNTKSIYELASNTKIDVTTNLGQFSTTIPEFKTTKEAKDWYIANGKDNLDVGDVCVVPVKDSNGTVTKKGYDGYIVKVTIPNKTAKFAKYDTGNYSYVDKFTNEKQTMSDSKLTVNIPAQYVKGTDSTANLHVTIQSKVTTIRVYKKDYKDGSLLEGHKFNLYDSNNNVFASGTTNKDGYYDFVNVPIGEYTVKETERPDDYKPKGIEYKVSATTNSVKKIISVTDDKAPSNNKKGSTTDLEEASQFGESSSGSFEDWANEEEVDPDSVGVSDADKCMIEMNNDCAVEPDEEAEKIIAEKEKNDELSDYYDELFKEQDREEEKKGDKATDEYNDKNKGNPLVIEGEKSDTKNPNVTEKNKNKGNTKEYIENQNKTKKTNEKTDNKSKETLPKTGQKSDNNYGLGIVSLLLALLFILHGKRNKKVNNV